MSTVITFVKRVYATAVPTALGEQILFMAPKNLVITKFECYKYGSVTSGEDFKVIVYRNGAAVNPLIMTGTVGQRAYSITAAMVALPMTFTMLENDTLVITGIHGSITEPIAVVLEYTNG